MQSQSHSLTLELVHAHFTHWRASRPHSRSPIPEELWQEAISLCDHYPCKSIYQRLGLNSSTFYKKKRWYLSSESSPHFVELNWMTPFNPLSTSPSVEFERGDGMKMRIESSGLGMSDLLTLFSQGQNASV